MAVTYVALLRAVNVGGIQVDPRALRDLATELGYRRVRSWLRTGNLLFDAPAIDTGRLEEQLARATVRHLGIETAYFVRTAREWAAIVAGNPFPDAADTDPSHLVVVALRTEPEVAAVRRLEASIVGRESVRPGPRCLYVTYPDGIGRSKLTLARIEAGIGSPGTARNWNTVLRLATMAGTPAGG